MGMLGTLYHTAMAGYNWLADDSEAAAHELDKAVDSLHKTMILDPIGVSDVPDIVEDITKDN